MRSINWLWRLLIVLPITALAVQAQNDGRSAVDFLVNGFHNPPPSARLRCYWWWLNGHTDEQTITSDLEAMKSKGYGGALLVDANGSSQNGNDPVSPGPTFDSPEWRKLFLHAVREAARLNLQISLNATSGWNLGGPTVKPEQSAKILTWSRTVVDGPKPFHQTLPSPEQHNGFYRDIAVLAYPLHHGAALPGDPQAPQRRNPIRLLKSKAVFQEAGFSAPDSKPLLQDFGAEPGEEDTSLSEVQDLSAKLQQDGEFDWQVPSGTWEVLRIGYTSSDARVSTSSGAWQGLAIDYLDHTAFQSYWDGNIKPLLILAKPYLGKSLKYLVTDSWELGGVNWTGRFRQEFQQRRQYDPIRYLPIVTGRIVQDRETSDRFLNDFRRTIGDLVISEHYQVFADHARQYGLGIHPESGGPHGAPIDSLETLGVSTFPQSEFWAPSKVHRSSDGDRFFIKEASSAAHIYGKTLAAGEGMTSIGPQWEESIGNDLKPAFDQALCAGLNLLVWHTFTSSPKSTGFPGQEYFAGTHLNPKVTWFKDAENFLGYINRSQFLMQQGLPVSDVLYYYGDQVPNFVQFKATDPAKVMPGYDYDVIDEQVLTHGLHVENKKIVLANGTSYRVLALPNLPNISMPALQSVERLARAGAIIIGNKPNRLTGLATNHANDEQVRRLASRIWGNCDGTRVTQVTYGLGKIFCGVSTRDVLKAESVLPDFEYQTKDSAASFDYVHRRLGQTEIYFVRNISPEPVRAEFIFRVKDRSPELWYPDGGTIVQEWLSESTPDRRTRIPVSLGPYGSIFIVFRQPTTQHFVRLIRDGVDVFPRGSDFVSDFEVMKATHGFAVRTSQSGHYELTDAEGRKLAAEVRPPASTMIGGPWKVAFTPGWGAPNTAEFLKLASWSSSQDPGIKYYSGTARYRNQFTISAEDLNHGTKVFLDLGEVHEEARVFVNGKDLGVVWKRPFSIDITAAIKAGDNHMEITVTNLWPNRIIGDQLLPVQRRFTHTNIKKYNASSPLLPSGLLGPVKIRFEAEVPLRPE